MHRLVVSFNGSEQVLEFETLELAQLYRDYHLAFGHWNGLAEWVEEKDLTQEMKPFVIKEKTELVFGKPVKFFRVTNKVEIRIDRLSPNTLSDIWGEFRQKRDMFLQLTDWTQLPDCELDLEQRKEYRAYRAYLRVLPKLYDNFTINNAKVYTFEDWKKGKR